LILIIPLLVDAHSAIGLIAVVTLAMALVTFVAVAGLHGLRVIAPRLAVAGCGAALLLAPTLLAELRFSRFYDPATKVTVGAEIAQDFVGFWLYFYDGAYRWLALNSHLDVQIDFAIWIPITIALFGGAVVWAITRRRPDRASLTRYLHVPSLVFLLVCLAIYLFLQLRISLWVYRVLAPLQVIDYPFRMLAFIVPIGVILVVMIADSAFRRFPVNLVPRILAVLWLISLIVLSPLTSMWTIQYPTLAQTNQFPSTNLSAPPPVVNYRTFKGFFSFNGLLYQEYLPKVFTANGTELPADGALYQRLHRHQDGAASLSTVPCTVLVPTKTPLESLALTFTVHCKSATRVALPVTFNAFSSVFKVSKNGKLVRTPYIHVRTDPRIIIAVPSSKTEVVVVHLPTLWGVLS
jgi:hypothetical protein